MKYKKLDMLILVMTSLAVVLLLLAKNYLASIWAFNCLMFFCLTIQKDRLIEMYSDYLDDVMKSYGEAVDLLKKIGGMADKDKQETQ